MALSSQSHAHHSKHLALKASVGKKSSPKILFGQIKIGGSPKEKSVKIKMETTPKKGTASIKARAKRKLSGSASPRVTQALVEELLASRTAKSKKAKITAKSTIRKVISSPKKITNTYSSEKIVRARKASPFQRGNMVVFKGKKALGTKKNTVKKASIIRSDTIVKKAKPITKRETFLTKRETLTPLKTRKVIKKKILAPSKTRTMARQKALASPKTRTTARQKVLASPKARMGIKKKTLVSPQTRTIIKKKTLVSPQTRTTIKKKTLVSPQERKAIKQKTEAFKTKMARTSFRKIKNAAATQKSSASKKNVMKKVTSKVRKTSLR